ncbi:MAG TPA: hypothetical protein VGE01_11180 [Fimbriimonas sp.]
MVIESCGLGATYRLTAEVLRWMDEDQLAILFETPSGDEEKEWVIRDPLVQAAARVRLIREFPVQDDGIERSPGAAEAWSMVRQRVDWRKPATIIFSTEGVAHAVFHGPDSRPFRLVL